MLHAGKYLNVIRECGRLDIKNPYEDLTSNDGFTFTKMSMENIIHEHGTGAAGSRDIQMNDESNDNSAGIEEERKEKAVVMIDTNA